MWKNVLVGEHLHVFLCNHLDGAVGMEFHPISQLLVIKTHLAHALQIVECLGMFGSEDWVHPKMVIFIGNISKNHDQPSNFG